MTNTEVVGRGKLAGIMRKALKCADDVRMLSVDDGYVPGYGEDARVSLQVLGPIPETLDGRTVYRVFGERNERFDSRKGKTKNGHSVVIKLRYGKVTMNLGGDLNIPAEGGTSTSSSNRVASCATTRSTDRIQACPRTRDDAGRTG